MSADSEPAQYYLFQRGDKEAVRDGVPEEAGSCSPCRELDGEARQEIRDPLLFKRQMLLDPVRVLIILFLCDRTGTVNKRSARFYILVHHRKDLSLQLREIFDFISRHPLFDIRLLSDNSKTGTWEIRPEPHLPAPP